MARLARLVVPGLPHHVTQRGNGGQKVFFEEDDYRLYTDLILEAAEKAGCAVWCYCWMPNHTHTILVPSDEDGLRRTFADAHRRYTGHVNARAKKTGHLWQGRFGSYVMDEAHLQEAVRYVSLNPVRAGLAKRAEDWPWSSAHLHVAGEDLKSFSAAPAIERFGDMAKFLNAGNEPEEAYSLLRRAETTGRPLGAEDWVEALEARTNRRLRPQKRGPKPK